MYVCKKLTNFLKNITISSFRELFKLQTILILHSVTAYYSSLDNLLF